VPSPPSLSYVAAQQVNDDAHADYGDDGEVYAISMKKLRLRILSGLTSVWAELAMRGFWRRSRTFLEF